MGDYAAAPLELCNRLVQEDLVLMRAADEPTAEPFGGAKHVMTAASVVFRREVRRERKPARPRLTPPRACLRAHPSFGDLDKKARRRAPSRSLSCSLTLPLDFASTRRAAEQPADVHPRACAGVRH